MVKKSLLKRGIVVLLAIVFICGIGAFYVVYNYPISITKGNPYQYKRDTNLDEKLTSEQVKEDREQLIDIIESTHPIFLEEITDKYKEEKNYFIKNTDKSMTVSDFQILVSRYMSSLQDGHTIIGWNGSEELDINWRYEDGKLILLDENNQLTNKIVEKINNIEVEEVIKFVKEIFPAENYIAENKVISRYSKDKLVLKRLGIDYSDDVIIGVKTEDSDEEIKVNFIQKNKSKNAEYEVKSEQLNKDTLYIKLEICEVNEDLMKLLDDIELALNNKVKKVIIDVRDNPGGNSEACSMILEKLGMKHGAFGSVIRFSPLAKQTYGYFRDSGSITFERSNDSEKNTNLDLYVITNENTF